MNVWSSGLGPGSHLTDGLHIGLFNKQEVLGIRLSSVPPSNPTLLGWGEAVFHFGRMAGTGSVKVSAASVLDVVAGEEVAVQTEEISVAAGGTVDVSGGDVRVTSDVVSVSSASLEAASEAITVTTEQAEVFSGGTVAVSTGTASLDTMGDVAVSSGAGVSVSAVFSR